jgi:SAM-dependent methyltransferase
MKISSCCSNNVKYNPLKDYFENLKNNGFLYDIKDLEFLNLEEYFCPMCGASDRDRFIAYYLKDKKFKSVLHISPSYPLNNFLKQKFENVVTGDLYMNNVDIKLDLCDMNNIPDQSYDLIICSHVLEHVENDFNAIKEIKRVLKFGGEALLLVPICLPLKEKDEDLNTTEAERVIRFGQSDHVRMYSKKSFIELIESVGECKEINIDNFTQQTFKNLGLTQNSTIYVLK